MKIPLADYVFNLQHSRDAIAMSNNFDQNNSYFNEILIIHNLFLNFFQLFLQAVDDVVSDKFTIFIIIKIKIR